MSKWQKIQWVENFTNAPDDWNTVGFSMCELAVKAGFVKSKTEARKLILGRGFRIQDRVVNDPDARMFESGETVFIVSKGRNLDEIP